MTSEATSTRARDVQATVEQASPLGWDRYAGPSGTIIAMRGFGASAPFMDLLKKFGFTPEKVMEGARAQIAKSENAKAHSARTLRG